MTLKEKSREELIAELAGLLEKEQEFHEPRIHELELEIQNRELRETQSALEASRARFEELYDFAPVAYFTLDEQGSVLEVNLSGATMVGGDRARIIGHPFLSLVTMERPATFWTHLRRCALQREAVATDMRFSTERHGSRHVQVVSAPVIGAEGRVTAFRTSFNDISRLKEVEVELARARDEERRLRKRLEDLDHATLAVNNALARVGTAPAAEFFEVVADQARLVADAELAALGVGSDPTAPFDTWVVSATSDGGSTTNGEAAPPRRPLAEVVQDGRAIRARAPSREYAETVFPGTSGVSCLLVVPIRFGGRIVGSFSVANKRGAPEFSDDDQRSVETLAERAGLAMEIARLGMEARTAAAARDNLLAVVSHDLRSPLHAIQLSANVLTLRCPEPDRRQNRKQIEIILRSTERMNHLIGDLLQVATIEAGAFSVELQREDVPAIVDQALDALEPVATAKSLQIERDVAEDLPQIEGDRLRIIQVLSNLVGNAIKFVGVGGKIRVRAVREGREISFSVVDDGPGIPDEQVRHLFDRYWKGKPDGRHGVGLGLYISKAIVEALGGRIGVETKLGVGSNFHFTVPIAPQTEVEGHAHPA